MSRTRFADQRHPPRRLARWQPLRLLLTRVAARHAAVWTVAGPRSALRRRPVGYLREVLLAMLMQLLFVALFLLAGCGDTGRDENDHPVPGSASETGLPTQVKATALATPAGARAALPVDAPDAVDMRSGRTVAGPPTRLLPPSRPVAHGGECTIDFTDPDALQLTGPSLWFDRTYLPWFQRCGSGFADLRPLVMEHVHIGFADAAVVPCNSHAQAYPSRVAPDGSCDLVDIRTEPRTVLTTHSSGEIVRLKTLNAAGDAFTAFDLRRLRVVAPHPARVCYRKSQAIDGDWLTAPGVHPGEPGAWLCWNRLAPGLWDLSAWATDVTEVRVMSARDEGTNFSIDDIAIAPRW